MNTSIKEKDVVINCKIMLLVEKANINDASFFVEIIEKSAGYFTKLFGNGIFSALIFMYKNENNLFSYQHVHKIQIDGENAAMILSYDYKTKRKENPGTGYLMFKKLKFNMFRNILILLKFNKTVGQLNQDEYYISNIAVSAKYQRQGLAKKLLTHVQQIAIEDNLNSLVLDVESNNATAIKLYLSLGYEKTDKFIIPIKNDELTFIRMKKPIQ